MMRSGKTLGRFVKDPKMRCHKLENMNVVMKALSEQEVRLVNIGVGELDVFDIHVNMIKNLIMLCGYMDMNTVWAFFRAYDSSR